MILSYKKILSAIREYIGDARHSQAILIDGDWGTGKTHFINKVVIPDLQELIKDSTQENKRKVIYLSLYGIESSKQILDELCSLVISYKIEEKLEESEESSKGGKVIKSLGDKAVKGASFVSKIIPVAASFFNIDTDKIHLSDFINLTDDIFIFDDLERCGISINEVLGFINNLVEHNKIKVIIVANQKEIGKTNLTNKLHEKYSIVLNPRLKIKNKDEKSNNFDKTNVRDKFSIDELKETTEELFSSDIFYERIKEKLIGLTLYFQPTFGMLFDEIVNEYIHCSLTVNFINTKKEYIITSFENIEYRNLRTLIFVLMCYEKFFTLIDKLEYDKKYLDEQKTQVLNYCITLGIQIKKGGKYHLLEDDFTHGIIYSLDINNKFVYAYKFVYDYMLCLDLNEVAVSDCVSLIIKEKIKEEEEKTQNEDLHKNSLYRWWELEDQEICKRLKGVYSDLKEDKYPARYYKDIIIYLLQLEYNKFHLQTPIVAYISQMVVNIEKDENLIETDELEIFSDDDELIKNYNEFMEPIFKCLIEKKENALCISIKEHCFDDTIDDWGDKFYEYCVTNRDAFLRDKKFFCTIDTEELLELLKEADLKNISGVLSGICEVYNFASLKNFFNDDYNSLKYFQKKLADFDYKMITRNIALNKIKTKIDNVIQSLERPNDK